MKTPVIILVRPQLVENIGAAARAMMNCNLAELRLVAPRDGWPLTSPQKERAMASSSGADSILEDAVLFESTADAVKDLHAVYATTARNRDMVKRILNPRSAVAEIIPRINGDEKIGLLFGPERTGLLNEDLMCAENIIHIPANPEFSSFNLAQTVLILAYEWLMQNSEAPTEELPHGKTRPATREELFHFFDHLERELDTARFFSTEAMKPAMVQNLRNALLRAQFTEQEVRTLHGVVTSLTLDPSRKRQHG